MSVEALWYSSYVRGERPHCARLSRRPMPEQWQASIELAIAYAEGRAGWRNVTISLTGEVYWYWQGSDSRTGWWLIPWRIDQRARRLYEAAIDAACGAGRGRCGQDDIVRVLHRWLRDGHWRRIAARTIPRHSAERGSPFRRKLKRRVQARLETLRKKHGSEFERRRIRDDVLGVLARPPIYTLVCDSLHRWRSAAPERDWRCPTCGESAV